MVVGRVVDQAGQPVTGFSYSGRMSNFDTWIRSSDETFEIAGYDPASPRRVWFAHEERKLAGSAVVTGNPPGETVVKLETAGKVSGRLVDQDGSPLVNYTILRWLPDWEGKVPPDWYQTVPIPPNPARPDHEEYETDAEGRFEIACLVPGVGYRLHAFNRDSESPGKRRAQSYKARWTSSFGLPPANRRNWAKFI